MVAPIIDPSPQWALVIGLKAFAAAIIGGLENPFGILIGGLLMGVTDSWCRIWCPAAQIGATPASSG